MEFKTKEEKKLATVMFEILDGIQSPNLVCNKNGMIIFSNKKYKEIAAKSPRMIPFWKVYPLTTKSPEYFNEAVKNEIESRTEIKIKDKTFIVRVIPIRNILVNEIIYIIYFEDITPQINLTNQLEIDKKAIQKAFLDTIIAFSEFVESRDTYTSGHQKRVARLSLNIASKWNITDPKLLSTIYFGALMHDIGKIGIPMEYLVTPRRLTEHEYGVMKSHVVIGNKIIEHMDFPWDIKSVVFQHHERIDGSGYPNGLKGEEITIPARIVAIADVYEAMSTNRPYRESLPHETILNYLKDNKGKLFDSYFIDCFFKCLSELKDVYQINPDFRPNDLLGE